ncbi:MAG: hypothetical protein JWO08_2662 [Verrucomicrobiaceae bacterium]|nr:hypothetical protein [Verrucomicrobiaceae bacterium]
MKLLSPIKLAFAALLLSMLGTSCYVWQPPNGSNGTLGQVGNGARGSVGPQVDEGYWNGDSMSGPPSIKIVLHEQRAYFYKGNQVAGVSPISSGREGLDTITGKFHIIEKDIDHKSSLFGDYVDQDGNVIQKEIDTSKDPKPKGARFDGARMPYFMRIVGGTGMHEGYLPGYPASHGCIRMPGTMAEAFYRSTPVGTPVTIAP